MSAGLDLVDIALPYRRLANQPFSLAWALAIADPSAPDGVPDDASNATAARVTAEQQVARGETPLDPKVWTLTSGVALSLISDSDDPDNGFWVLSVTEPTGLPAGSWLVKTVLTRDGLPDWVNEVTLELTEQP